MFFDKAIVIMIDDEYYTRMDTVSKPSLSMYLFNARFFSHIDDKCLKDIVRTLRTAKVKFFIVQVGVLKTIQHL